MYNAATVEDAELTDGKRGDDMKEEEEVVVVEAEVCRVREGAVDDKAPAAAAMLSCHAPSSPAVRAPFPERGWPDGGSIR